MATSTKRNNPVRTTNNSTAAVRTDRTKSRATECTKVLRAIGKRSDATANHLTKTYDDVECIAQTVDALRVKIGDGQVSANAIIKMLESIESRLHAVEGRLNYAELTCATIAGDAEWVADGNSY